MGGSSASSSDVRSYFSTNTHISRARDAKEVFCETRMNPLFDPSLIKLPREACDSPECPNSRGIIYAEDVTGSMDTYLLNLIQEQFPKLIEQTHNSVSYNPHIMFMGVGDVAAGDIAPLQVTQFEADLRMLQQLQQIWLEEHGGGNGSESYILPWYFAAKHIHMDCWEKRREKGFIFTFGDDGPTPRLTRSEIKTVFGKNSSIEQSQLTAEECLRMASEKFNCYHIMIGIRDSYYSSSKINKWKSLMGNRAIILNDHHYVSELVTTILRMHEGETKTAALRRIENSRARKVVEEALRDHEEVVETTTASKPNGSGHKIEVF